MSDSLQNGEARSQVILQAVADGIVTIDERGMIDWLNPAAENIFGYAHIQTVGRNIHELIPEYDERLAVSGPPDPLEAETPRSSGFRREMEGRRKDGSRFSIDLAVTEVEIAGRRHSIIVVRELTGWLEDQNDLRLLAEIVNSVDDGIISCDSQGIIKTWNKGAAALYGYTAEEAVGYPLQIITPQEFAPTLGARIRTALAGEISGSFETQRLTKYHRTVDVSISVSRILDAQGDVIGLAAVHRDVSSQKLAQKAQRDLFVFEERNRLDREIHDTLAQSLTVMVLRLDLAGETMESDPAAARAGLDSIKLLAAKCVEEARRSIWDLQPQALDSAGLVEALKNEVARLSENGIDGELRVEGAEAIEMDPRNQSAALRIVQEALNNIINHSKAKTALVSLYYYQQELKITVADNGIGFEHLTNRTVSASGGGFGLTSMRERALLAGGSAVVQSTPGQGTTVEIRIPYDSPNPGITVGG